MFVTDFHGILIVVSVTEDIVSLPFGVSFSTGKMCYNSLGEVQDGQQTSVDINWCNNGWMSAAHWLETTKDKKWWSQLTAGWLSLWQAAGKEANGDGSMDLDRSFQQRQRTINAIALSRHSWGLFYKTVLVSSTHVQEDWTETAADRFSIPLMLITTYLTKDKELGFSYPTKMETPKVCGCSSYICQESKYQREKRTEGNTEV